MVSATAQLVYGCESCVAPITCPDFGHRSNTQPTKPMNKEAKLPDKLSDLIDVALKDYIAVKRRNKTYVIDMCKWHCPTFAYNESGKRTEEIKCHVCLAGCVMANTFKISHESDLRPSDLVQLDDGIAIQSKLCALDKVRLGMLTNALSYFGVVSFHATEKGMKTHWERNPCDDMSTFVADMRAIARYLRKFGY